MREIRKPNRTGDIFDKNSKVNSLGEFKEPKKKDPLNLKENTPLKKEVLTDSDDSEFVEVENLPLPFSAGNSLPSNDEILKQSKISKNISEDTRRTQKTSEITRTSQTISEEPRRYQNSPEDIRTSRKTSEDVRRPQNHSKGESYPLSPDRMDFLLLDGHGKRLLEVLIEYGAGEKPVLIKSDELKAKTGQSTNHLSDTIIRLEKKGYLRVKKSYGKGIFEVNPSIF
jgi:hypothetical protein